MSCKISRKRKVFIFAAISYLAFLALVLQSEGNATFVDLTMNALHSDAMADTVYDDKEIEVTFEAVVKLADNFRMDSVFFGKAEVGSL